jgi:uncharacterized protein YciI
MRILITSCIILSAFCLQAQSYTFVFLNARTDKEELPKEELDNLMKGHMANMERLANEGKLLVAGPFEGGGGIFIFNTTSVDEAQTWLGTDPGVQAKRWRVEVLPYQPRIGSVCPVGKDYEMTTYTFIRFKSNIHKETVGDYPVLLKQHDEYVRLFVRAGNVITEGTFGDQEGSILIIKGDVDPETFENDPGVKGGTLLVEQKKLWIAKGSFCEK